MPSAAMRPCSYPGCTNLVRSGRCAQHPLQDMYHRPDHQRLYNTRRWKKLRLAQLTRQPWCEVCLRANIYTPATDVDHVEPHRGDANIFFTGALQSLCHTCHSSKTASEVWGGVGAGQKDLTWGAASGRGLPREKNSPMSA